MKMYFNTISFLTYYDFTSLTKGDIESFKEYYNDDKCHDSLFKHIVKTDDIILFKEFVHRNKYLMALKNDKNSLSRTHILDIIEAPENDNIFQYLIENHKQEILDSFPLFVTDYKLNISKASRNKVKKLLECIFLYNEKKDVIKKIEDYILSGFSFNLKSPLLYLLRKANIRFSDFNSDILFYLQKNNCKWVSYVYKVINKQELHNYKNKEKQNYLHFFLYQQKNKDKNKSFLLYEFDEKILRTENIQLLTEKDNKGNTPLHLFIELKSYIMENSIIPFIHSNNIDLNITDENNNTYYHLINFYNKGYYNFLCLMLDGDPTVLNNNNQRPIDILAKEIQDISLQQFLIRFKNSTGLGDKDTKKQIKKRL